MDVEPGQTNACKVFGQNNGFQCRTELQIKQATAGTSFNKQL